MPRRVDVREVDKGWRKLRRELTKARGNPTVVVGVIGSKGGAGHGEGGATVAEIASFHEFGRGNNPERSFIRNTVDRHSIGSGRDTRGRFAKNYPSLFATLGGAVLDGKMTTKRALSLAGLRIQGDMVDAINRSIDLKPLSEATVARKGSSKPLIDTGQLKGSITFRVEGV